MRHLQVRPSVSSHVKSKANKPINLDSTTDGAVQRAGIKKKKTTSAKSPGNIATAGSKKRKTATPKSTGKNPTTGKRR